MSAAVTELLKIFDPLTEVGGDLTGPDRTRSTEERATRGAALAVAAVEAVEGIGVVQLQAREAGGISFGRIQ